MAPVPTGAGRDKLPNGVPLVQKAIWEEMERDPSVFVMGEDVATYGGVYKVTQGMLEHFGPKRVRDSAISEAAIVGAGIGAAMQGERPTRVNLKTPLKVVLFYVTAHVDSEGVVHFVDDIYGHDAILDDALRQGYPYPTAAPTGRS